MMIDGRRRSSFAPLPSTCGRIEHHVSRLDTLAGIAIKYGVEVEDIKRMNSLVSDLHMFAHKKLQIPLPGRHPPSQDLSNGSSCNGDIQVSSQWMKSKPPHKGVSSAMSSLQGYYGLAPPKEEPVCGSTELAVFNTGTTLNLEVNGLPPVSPASGSLPHGHRKTKSLYDGFFSENSDLTESLLVSEGENYGDSERSSTDNSVRRRQKTDVQAPSPISYSPLEDNERVSSGRAGKAPIPRPKSGTVMDLDTVRSSSNPIGDLLSNGFFSGRRSSSTSNLQDSGGSCLWSTTMWTSKMNTSRPLFDGFPNPVGTRKIKTALD